MMMAMMSPRFCKMLVGFSALDLALGCVCWGVVHLRLSPHKAKQCQEYIHEPGHWETAHMKQKRQAEISQSCLSCQELPQAVMQDLAH
jgi:hypothetical protein